ncbi:8298_t:CDS:2 [Acaulospora morrowiae]|uniref:8298_t:CDS:1 n=1 Tax=Acaulospora morrowiae TaxID=94023 RepID=A0A9N9F519_9GLOM|nr:8298_t:CDS:2 [Acaulospora morrowiae]
MGESPHSIPTFNSLSTSSTSSNSSLLNQAPISTSLPSFSSSVSTYVGPVAQSNGSTSNAQTSMEGNGTFPLSPSSQQRQMTQASQIFSPHRTPLSLSGRSVLASPNPSVASIMNTAPPTSLIPPIPHMERSNSTSTLYSTSSGPLHEKSMSTGSIATNSSSNMPPYKHDILKDPERYEHDKWSTIVVKVLPLFNGEGLKACIEDLNELVRNCIKDRSQKSLYDDINSLLLNGMSTLNGKLRGVPDEKLVSRLVELWSFYLGTVIPYFEGVFLPLQVQTTAQHRDHMSVRRLVLMSFRDHVILPMGDRVEDAFNKLFHDFDSGIPVTDTAARMLQMSYILSSILSDDDKQKDMDRILGKLKNNWKLFMRRRDRRGFVGMSPSNSNSSTMQQTTEITTPLMEINSNFSTTPTTISNSNSTMNGISATMSPVDPPPIKSDICIHIIIDFLLKISLPEMTSIEICEC